MSFQFVHVMSGTLVTVVTVVNVTVAVLYSQLAQTVDHVQNQDTQQHKLHCFISYITNVHVAGHLCHVIEN